MTKAEFIASIAEKVGKPRSEVDIMISATFETIAAALAEDEKIAVPGFGSFATKVRKERKGRNPSTGKEIIIPKTIITTFKAATQLKEIINSGQQE